MDTVNTPLLGSLLILFLASHAIAAPQHCYTRMQHVNICTLSDKLGVNAVYVYEYFLLHGSFLFFLHFDSAMVPCTLR
jgi:hypothetical protein